MRNLSMCLMLFALCLWTFFGTAGAATTGKIEGVVRDGQTGEPLPGANVVIDGTRRGAMTDANGVYVILLVEPGTYSLTASMVGYDAQRQTGVRVQSDFTTTVNFAIREAALELGEITVIAERPPVEVDRTTSLYITSAEDIAALPIVRDAADLIELQAGVQVNNAGTDLLIRGGTTRDVGYYVDGVRITSTDHRGTRVYRNVNTSAIQEMTVITGGMNAEYGNAQGGVVSFVTREGGSRYTGMADYQFTPPGQKHWGTNVYDAPMHRNNIKWDDPEWVAEQYTFPDGRSVQVHRRLPYTEKMGHRIEGNLGGPLTQNISFFATSRWNRAASVFPSPNLVTPFNTNNTFRITSTLSPSFKLSVSGLYDRRKGLNGGPAIGGQLNLNDGGKNIFMVDPTPSGEGVITDALYSAQITHSLSPRTFYELRLSYSASSRDTMNVKLPTGLAHISEATSSNVVKEASGYFNAYRGVVNFQRYDYRRIILKGDLSSQINRQNFVKTGFEMISYNNWEMNYWSDGPSHRRMRWFSRRFNTMDFWPGQESQGVRPVQIGVYLQDKIEFEGMIVNAGIRGDLFFQREYVNHVDGLYGGASPMWTLMSRQVDMPTTKGPTIKGVSPRLGVSHPLTANSLVRFFYGRFIQNPTFQNLYTYDFISPAGQDRDLNGNGVIDPAERWNTFEARGNFNTPSLPPEETTSFELGLDWNFVGDYVASLSTYYKASGNEVVGASQLFRDPAAGQPYIHWGSQGWAPGAYRDVRGFELSLRKRFSNMFAFTLAYNQQWHDWGRNTAARRDTWPDSQFVANGHYWVDWDVDPATGREVPVPLTEKARREGLPDDHYIIRYGQAAQNHIRSQQTVHDARSQWSWIPWLSVYSAQGVEVRPGDWVTEHYTDSHRDYWERNNSNPNYPGFGEGNLLVGHSQETAARAPEAHDRRGFGSMTFLFATPADFGPANGAVLGNIRTNLVYRMYTGTSFSYTSLALGVDSHQTGPMTTRTDLNVEKQFGLGRGDRSLTLALEVYNLFNDKDVRMISPGGGRGVDFNAGRWQRFGIEGREPTDADWQYGEINDINNYWDAPRELRFSARVRW